MALRVLASTPDGHCCREVELDAVALMFFDTLIASLNAEFPDQKTPFDFFEYTDSEGECISVRTDDELQTLLEELVQSNQEQNGGPIKIRLRSNRSNFHEQCSFDEMDDIILAPAALLAGTSLSKGGDCVEGKAEVNVEAIHMRKAIGPEDLRLIERISEGQFGTVYKALDVKNDQLLAVKCLSLDTGGSTRHGLLNEIAILRQCVHANIVDFHAALFLDSQLLICMELMDAFSLDLYGQLPDAVLGAVSVAVVDGLGHLWARQIMHRDIKPSNFLVNTAGEVKLADFGVSKQMAQSIAWSYVGTKVYMAPERIGGEVYNVASDIWSLGLALAEMALGRFPLNSSPDSAIPSSIEFLMFSSAERIAALLNDPIIQKMANSFALLLSGCLRLLPNARLSPESVIKCQFLQSNRPMDNLVVSKFVKEKRSTMVIN